MSCTSRFLLLGAALRMLSIACLLAIYAPAQDSIHSLFEDFLRWRYDSGREFGGVMTRTEAIRAYRAKLIEQGRTEAEANAIAQDLDRNWVQLTAYRWDKVFANTTSSVNRKPNRWLVDAVKDRRPGRALDIGMGAGRNSIYLAEQGWDVTGFDIASQAVSQAKAAAQKLGVRFNAIVDEEEKFDYGARQWDLIVDCYEFNPIRTLNDRIRNALKSKGIWVIEGFARTNEQKQGYESGELLKRLAGLRIVRYEEISDVADFGLDTVPLIRVVAEKQ